jgi:hypothetical protein
MTENTTTPGTLTAALPCGSSVSFARCTDGYTPTMRSIYLFIYLFLILACNRRVMAEATDYGTLSGDRVLHLSPAGIRPRAVCQVRVVVPFLLLVSLFCGRRLVQEPCTLGGHHAGSSSLSSILPLPFFPFFPAFISSAVRVLTKES